jgi:hypothetical protein
MGNERKLTDRQQLTDRQREKLPMGAAAVIASAAPMPANPLVALQELLRNLREDNQVQLACNVMSDTLTQNEKEKLIDCLTKILEKSGTDLSNETTRSELMHNYNICFDGYYLAHEIRRFPPYYRLGSNPNLFGLSDVLQHTMAGIITSRHADTNQVRDTYRHFPENTAPEIITPIPNLYAVYRALRAGKNVTLAGWVDSSLWSKQEKKKVIACLNYLIFQDAVLSTGNQTPLMVKKRETLARYRNLAEMFFADKTGALWSYFMSTRGNYIAPNFADATDSELLLFFIAKMVYIATLRGLLRLPNGNPVPQQTTTVTARPTSERTGTHGIAMVPEGPGYNAEPVALDTASICPHISAAYGLLYEYLELLRSIQGANDGSILLNRISLNSEQARQAMLILDEYLVFIKPILPRINIQNATDEHIHAFINVLSEVRNLCVGIGTRADFIEGINTLNTCSNQRFYLFTGLACASLAVGIGLSFVILAPVIAPTGVVGIGIAAVLLALKLSAGAAVGITMGASVLAAGFFAYKAKRVNDDNICNATQRFDRAIEDLAPTPPPTHDVDGEDDGAGAGAGAGAAAQLPQNPHERTPLLSLSA